MSRKILAGLFAVAAVASFASDSAHAFGKPKPRPTPTPTPTATATPTPTPTSAPVFSSDEQTREAVRRAYLAILQRHVDPSGAAGYFNQIKSDGLAGWKNGLHNIADSAEFRDNVRPNKSDAQILESIYRYFLLRGVDSSGAQTYLPMIAAGKTGDVAEAVGASAEFFEAIKKPLPQPTPTPTATPTPTPTATPTPTPTPTPTSKPVWPKTGREVVEFVRVRHPEKLVVTATLQERKDNMAFIRDRMIEAGICGGMDLGLNLKRGGPEISIDYLAYQAPVGLRGVDIGMAYDDHHIPLQLYWGEQEDPYAKYKYYEPRPNCN